MNTRKKRALTGFTLILVYVFGFLVFWFFNFQRVVVRGDSMKPTFNSGQVLWACKAYWIVGGIQQKDIVVVKDEEDGEYLIKRVHRRGGEVVDPLYVPFDFSLAGDADEYKVPAGHYYVLGDNLEHSHDSRTFGSIPVRDVIGKYVPFTWVALVLAIIPVLVLLLFATWRSSEQGSLVSSPDAAPL